jgi:hypothetical protein
MGLPPQIRVARRVSAHVALGVPVDPDTDRRWAASGLPAHNPGQDGKWRFDFANVDSTRSRFAAKNRGNSAKLKNGNTRTHLKKFGVDKQSHIEGAVYDRATLSLKLGACAVTDRAYSTNLTRINFFASFNSSSDISDIFVLLHFVAGMILSSTFSFADS